MVLHCSGQRVKRPGPPRRRELGRIAEGPLKLQGPFQFGHIGRVDERRLRAHVRFDFGVSQQTQDFREISGAFGGPHIARDRRDGGHLHLIGAAQNHHQRGAIVAEEAAVGVEDDLVGSGRGGGQQEKRP